MSQKTIRTIAMAALALVPVLCAARPAHAQYAKTPYPTSMVPLDQYLIWAATPPCSMLLLHLGLLIT